MKDYEKFIPYTNVDLEKISQQFEFSYEEMQFRGAFNSKNYYIVFEEITDFLKKAIKFDFRLGYTKNTGCIVYPRLVLTDHSYFSPESSKVYFKSIENRWSATPLSFSKSRNTNNKFDDEPSYTWVCLLSAEDLEMLRNICKYKELSFCWLDPIFKTTLKENELNVIEKFVELCDETGVTNQMKRIPSMTVNFDNITDFNENN